MADLAARLLPAQADAGQVSALDKAKSAILNQLAVEILREASQALPDVIEQLRPGFERAVTSFVEAVENLPEKLTSEALVAAGPRVLSECQVALAASQLIHALDSWLASLKDLPGFAGLPPATPMLRVWAPATRVSTRSCGTHTTATRLMPSRSSWVRLTSVLPERASRSV